MIKWIKKLFSKAPSNPYGIDERKLREAVNANLPLAIIKAGVQQGFMEYRQRETVGNIYTLDKTKKGYWFAFFLGQSYEIIGYGQGIIFHV